MERFSDNEKELLQCLLINFRNNPNEVSQNLRDMEKKKVKQVIIEINNINIITTRKHNRNKDFVTNVFANMSGYEKGRTSDRKKLIRTGALSRSRRSKLRKLSRRNCVKILDK